MNLPTDETEYRDTLARALRAERHREIAEEIERTAGDDDCGGNGSERCGGCAMCLYMQSTWSAHTKDGWAADQARADRILAHVRAEQEHRAAGATA